MAKAPHLHCSNICYRLYKGFHLATSLQKQISMCCPVLAGLPMTKKTRHLRHPLKADKRQHYNPGKLVGPNEVMIGAAGDKRIYCNKTHRRC